MQNMPLFRDGGVEVQDEGSQLLAQIVGAKRGEMVVDFCAGAGGKTLALGVAMRNTLPAVCIRCVGTAAGEDETQTGQKRSVQCTSRPDRPRT